MTNHLHYNLLLRVIRIDVYKRQEQRWPDLNYGSGYYEQKTNLTKEDAA